MTPQLAKWDGCINYCKADVCTDCRKLCFFSPASHRNLKTQCVMKKSLNKPIRQQMNDRPDRVSTAQRIVCSKLQKPLSTKSVIKSTHTPVHACTHILKKDIKKTHCLWFLAMHLLGFGGLWAEARAAQWLQLLRESPASSRQIGIRPPSSRFCI